MDTTTSPLPPAWHAWNADRIMYAEARQDHARRLGAQGVTTAEIARRLGCTPTWVRTIAWGLLKPTNGVAANRQLAMERKLLSILRARGAEHRPKAGDKGPALGYEAREQAIGLLNAILAITGEKPWDACWRLKIKGAHRHVVVRPDENVVRMTHNQRHAQRVAQGKAARVSTKWAKPEAVQEANQRRANALGIVLDSPEWMAQLRADESWLAKRRRMRREATIPALRHLRPKPKKGNQWK